jgi:septum formation protein
MEKMGLTFDIIPSKFEEHLDHARSTEEVAVELALGKANDVAKKYPEAIVIGSDTIVSVDGKQYGKPKDEQDARQTLILLAGRTNIVTTAVVVVCKAEDTEMRDVISSIIFFKPLNRTKLETYLAAGDWHDKAGSYGIQGGAAPLIERIEGEYDAVLGLPTRPLADMLRAMGVSCRPAQIEKLVPTKLP